MNLLDKAPDRKSKRSPPIVWSEKGEAANTLLCTNLIEDASPAKVSILEVERLQNQQITKSENRELFLANIVSDIVLIS